MKRNAISLLFIFLFSIVSLAQYDEVGSVVDDITTLNYNGDDIYLDDFSDQSGIMIVFTSKKCKEATAYTSKLSNLHKQYAPQGYPLIAVDITSLDDDFDGEPGQHLSSFVKKNKIDFLYASDPDQDLFQSFFSKKQNLPYAFLLKKFEIDEEPVFEVFYMGALGSSSSTTNYLEAAIKKSMKTKVVKSFDDEDDDKKRKKNKSSSKQKDAFLSETKVSSKCSSNKL